MAHTDESEEDYQTLHAAYQAISDVVSGVNEYKRVEENMNKIHELQSKLEGQVFSTLFTRANIT